MKKKIIILYSGGADSTLMVHIALKQEIYEVVLLMFKYGQKHEEELDYAKKMAYELNKRFSDNMLIYELNLLSAFSCHKSNLLQDSEATYQGVHENHVPGRNGVFVTLALGLAESIGAEEVWIGCDYSDRENLFPDCYQEWIYRMNKIAEINGSYPIKIKAPLLGLSKEDIINILHIEEYNLSKIYSGYSSPQKEEK